MNIQPYLKAWIKQCMLSDMSEVRKVWFKASGIEYRIMQEGRAVVSEGAREVSEHALVCDRAISVLKLHGRDLKHLIHFYKRDSMKDVARTFNTSRHTANNLVKGEELLLEGAIIMILGGGQT